MSYKYLSRQAGDQSERRRGATKIIYARQAGQAIFRITRTKSKIPLTMSEKLDVFGNLIYDSSIVSRHLHTYTPYGSPTYKNSDEVRIPVNFQDLILDTIDSYLYIKGKFTHTDAAKNAIYLTMPWVSFSNKFDMKWGASRLQLCENPE